MLCHNIWVFELFRINLAKVTTRGPYIYFYLYKEWPFFSFIYIYIDKILFKNRDRRGRDRMVAGFITAYAISACHH